MNKRQDAEKIRRALDAALSGLQDDPWLAQRVAAAAKGKKKVKKKISIGFVFAFILVLAFAGLAAALTNNLFEWFGPKQQRLYEIAAESEIGFAVPAVIDSEQWGESTVTVTNAYYDGDALLIGYTVENAIHTICFAPTDEQRAKMSPSNDAAVAVLIKDPAMQEAYLEAKKAGRVFGIVQSSVALSSDWYADDHIWLGTWNEMDDLLSDGIRIFFRDFDELPEALRQRERITVHMDIIRKLHYLYFDGENTYMMEETVNLSPVELCVEATDSELYYFDGESELYHFNGEADPVENPSMAAVATASDVRLTVQITAEDERILELPDGLWFDMSLEDEAGNLYECVSSEMPDDKTLFFTFNGCGKAPETLTGYLMIIGDPDGTEYITIPFRKRNP